MEVDEPLEEPPRISAQPQRIEPLIHLVDSPELQETGDQSPDPRPVPLADGLRDAPQRDRCQGLGLGRRPWIRSVTNEVEGMAWKKMED